MIVYEIWLAVLIPCDNDNGTTVMNPCTAASIRFLSLYRRLLYVNGQTLSEGTMPDTDGQDASAANRSEGRKWGGLSRTNALVASPSLLSPNTSRQILISFTVKYERHSHCCMRLCLIHVQVRATHHSQFHQPAAQTASALFRPDLPCRNLEKIFEHHYWYLFRRTPPTYLALQIHPTNTFRCLNWRGALH